MKFVDLILEVKPDQVTLVPDEIGQITSDHGWDTIKNRDYLKEIFLCFKKKEYVFQFLLYPVIEMIEGAAKTGTNRIELYTESYAKYYFWQ